MASINSSIFKTANSFEDVCNFFRSKGFFENEDTDIESEILENRNHKHFSIGPDSLLAILSYSDTDDSKKAEKEFDYNSYVNYLILVKYDISEYIFCKKDIGTNKTLKLKKKKDSIEISFLKKLQDLKYDGFESFEKLFDRSELIDKFYDLYCVSERYLINNIEGIPTEEEKELFVKILMNRMLFLWFLQKKSFLDGNINYFIDNYRATITSSRFYYEDFLKTLFFKGLCYKKNERDSDTNNLIGNIPYLNGGLFIESEEEIKYKIKIKNELFYRDMTYPIDEKNKDIPLLNLLESKDWTIDERSGEVDKISPEILGYIFEKSINQKELGAVYTPEEITNYIAKNTIHPYLIDRYNKLYKTEYTYSGNIINDLFTNVDKKQLTKFFNDVIKKMRILDPAVGSGHFLIDTISVLENIYLYFKKEEIIDWNNYEIKEYIIRENLYGVDILPGAIEICKLRMFLNIAESFKDVDHIRELPNIEFNFRRGNSIIGFSSKEDFNNRLGNNSDSVITLTKEMILLRECAPNLVDDAQKIVSNPDVNPLDLFNLRTELVKIYKELHNKELQEKFRHLLNILTEAFNSDLNSHFYGKIKNLFDMDKELKKLTIIQKKKLLNELRVFHWIMEYSEVLEEGGFDICLGNPPWDIYKPIEKEFFYKYDTKLTKYNVDKIEAKKIIDKLKKDQEISKKWDEHKNTIVLGAKYFNKSEYYKYQSDKIEGKTVSGDLNLYKLFTERFHQLTKKDGYCGIVTPSGLYTDAGTKGIRKLLFEKSKVTDLYCFVNTKGIFKPVHRSFKFIIVLFKKGEKSESFDAAFMLEETSILKKIEKISISIDWNLIKKLSPQSWSIIEFKNNMDIQIVKKMYQHPILRDFNNGTEIKFFREIDMTNDSRIFNKDKKGLTLYEGKMIEQYINNFENPRFWIEENKGLQKLGVNYKDYKEYRLGFRAVASSTNRRSLISTILHKNVFVGNSIIVTKIYDNNVKIINEKYLLYLCGIFNSHILDYLLRLKITTNLNMFFIYELPIPQLSDTNIVFNKIVNNVAELICVSSEYNDLKKIVNILNGTTDKSKRQKILMELENIIKDLYSLTDSEFKYVLDSFN